MAFTGDGQTRTQIWCVGPNQHALWQTDVAYSLSDKMSTAVWVTSSPVAAGQAPYYEDEPLDKPTSCPLCGSALMRTGENIPNNSQARINKNHWV
jgi:hypothetical protein